MIVSFKMDKYQSMFNINNYCTLFKVTVGIVTDKRLENK